jgi:hypothetical protein
VRRGLGDSEQLGARVEAGFLSIEIIPGLAARRCDLRGYREGVGPVTSQDFIPAPLGPSR